MDLSVLNEAQRRAVTETEGFVRVVAGAGSGKTRALTYRFAYLVEELGILPGNILCVTFTNKAANEMRQRIHLLTGDSDTGYINTFHGFCVSILKEDGNQIRYPKNFMVLDNSDINAMLRVIYEERGLTLRNMSFGDARDMIEMQKLFKKPEYYLDLVTDSPETLKAKYLGSTTTEDIIFYGYLYQEKKCFGLDYNDLILLSLYVFRQNEDVKRKWQQRLEYIMIDEFQDIDLPQYELMKVLCDYHRNLFIVGDPDQTVYTWRGANVKYLLDFDRDFPGTKTLMMTENYRSTPQILNVANSLIEKNKSRIPKDLLPTLPEGAPAVWFHGGSQDEEALWIAAEIERLHEEGVPYRDFTLLYRAHYVTRPLEKAFLDCKIPYKIYSGAQFYDRAEIKDALSYLRLVIYRDDLSFQRICNVPKRNLGQKRMKALREYAEKKGCLLYTALQENLEEPLFKGTGGEAFVRLVENISQNAEKMTVSELLSLLLDKSGYELMLRTEGSQDRLDNLAELKQSVLEFETECGEETSAEAYLTEIALYTAGDLPDTSDQVKMMTVHAAKGLEFPNVFVCGLDEGIFPSRRVRTQDAMEEERRLAFVAITRAEQRLYLTDCEGKNLDFTPRFPSRFILDLDPAYLQTVKKPADSLIRSAKEYVASKDSSAPEPGVAGIFPEGTRVRHNVFGEGTILGRDEEKKAYSVKFDSVETTRNVAYRIPLKKI